MIVDKRIIPTIDNRNGSILLNTASITEDSERTVSTPPTHDRARVVRVVGAALACKPIGRFTRLPNCRNELIREHGIVVPSISTAGARNLMQRLCEEADLEIDGEYLKPHGGRRGLGHELYSKGHAELAQTALRHSSIETTHEAYSDIQAKETAKKVDEVLDG